jgi:unspecific monooxygenase
VSRGGVRPGDDVTGFDAYAAAFVEDPYPTYAELRAKSPIFFDDTWGLTFFTRHADVAAILKDRRFGRDVRQAVPADEVDPEVFARIYPAEYPTWTRLIRDSFIDLEPPRHTRIRRLVQHAFGRRASESYRARIEATAHAALDRGLEAGAIEVIDDFATPIPLTMIAELLGVPAADQPRLVEWSHASVRLFDEACTPEEGARAEQAMIDFEAYVAGMLVERRTRPADDLTTALLEAGEEGDRLSDEELIATCILTLNAGHEATVQAIGNAVLAFARHPAQFERLRADPGLAGTAVEEVLRYDTPLQMFERWVLEDLEWGGVPLRRGSKVGLLFGSANHDEERFERPEQLDIGRVDNPHVSFGGGIHFCVGAPLARVELDVALRTLAERVVTFELTADRLQRTPSLVFRGVRRLPVTLGG